MARRILVRLSCCLAVALCVSVFGQGSPQPLSPTAIATNRDGSLLYIACATGNALLVVNRDGATQRRIELPAAPSGVAVSPDGTMLAVTCAAPQSVVCLVEGSSGKITARLPAGHTAQAPVFSGDGRLLYVCNRFHNEVVVYDVAGAKQVGRIPVDREPVAAALTPDGKTLFAVNHLHSTAATSPNVGAIVSVIDTATRRVAKRLRLPNGSGLLLGVAISPDGRHVAVTHNLGRYTLPTTQLDRGWMNTAALTLIDVSKQEILNTVLLDNVELGAANPWAVAWRPGGAQIVVSHAGTHEVSVIDFPRLLAKLETLPANLPPGQTPDYTKASNVRSDVPNDLAFTLGLRERVRLKGNGPRALAIAGQKAWVVGYFSDSLEAVDLGTPGAKPVHFALGPAVPMTKVRRGEMLFNDATICFQQWQSCASCHSYDARVDGLNWDLLNDGIGNAKNAKSLLWSHRTPPAMSMGVRDTAEMAVRAGIRYILFSVEPAEVPAAMDAYLKSLSPAPSPYLENGKLSKAAQRGKKLFESSTVGCARCHPADLYTDLGSYDVGTRPMRDRSGAFFDTPTLVELWRTGPYLHNGSARTIRDVLVRNPENRHGRTSHLTDQEIDDLAAYVLSL